MESVLSGLQHKYFINTLCRGGGGGEKFVIWTFLNLIHWKRFRMKRSRKQSVTGDCWLLSKFYLNKYKIMSIVMHKYQPSSVLFHLPPSPPLPRNAWLKVLGSHHSSLVIYSEHFNNRQRWCLIWSQSDTIMYNYRITFLRSCFCSELWIGTIEWLRKDQKGQDSTFLPFPENPFPFLDDKLYQLCHEFNIDRLLTTSITASL